MTIDVGAQLREGFAAMGAAQWQAAHDAFVEVLDIAEVPEALMGLASTRYWLGDLEGMIDALERAYAASIRSEDPMLAIGAALSLVGYEKQFVGNVTAARGWLARAGTLIRERAPELRGELAGATSFVTDDPVESERLARAALAIGRADAKPDLELAALTAVGFAVVQQGRVDEGMVALDEAMAGAIGGECGDPLTVAHISCMTLLVCASYFDIARATDWLRAMERFVDQYGCPFLYAECRTHYGRVLFENGDWATAETFLREAISMSTGKTPASHALASGTLAELLLARGDIEEAARLLDGLADRVEAVVALAALHLARGEAELAAAVARRRVDAVGSDRLDVAGVIEQLGQAEIALGRIDTAVDRGRALLKLGSAHDCALIVGHAHRLLGRAQAAIDIDAARAHIESALAAFNQAETPYRAAQTRLALAQLLAKTDDAIAVDEARTALAALEDLGARTEADAAAALLRELGVPAARSGPRNIGRLTARELEVLGLLGEGLSNPDIAERLFISRKTVEHHVERILAKLGARTRGEAAALARRDDRLTTRNG